MHVWVHVALRPPALRPVGLLGRGASCPPWCGLEVPIDALWCGDVAWVHWDDTGAAYLR